MWGTRQPYKISQAVLDRTCHLDQQQRSTRHPSDQLDGPVPKKLKMGLSAGVQIIRLSPEMVICGEFHGVTRDIDVLQREGYGLCPGGSLTYNQRSNKYVVKPTTRLPKTDGANALRNYIHDQFPRLKSFKHYKGNMELCMREQLLS